MIKLIQKITGFLLDNRPDRLWSKSGMDEQTGTSREALYRLDRFFSSLIRKGQ